MTVFIPNSQSVRWQSSSVWDLTYACKSQIMETISDEQHNVKVAYRMRYSI